MLAYIANPHAAAPSLNNANKLSMSSSDASPSPQEKRPFVFLKTHKTGSSTVTALILRKCMKDRLNCFIPTMERPGKTFDMRKDYSEITRGRGLYGGKFPYDVWCHHVRFDNRLMSVIENSPQGRMFISIVRRPSKRFQSAWHWYDHGAAESPHDHSGKLNMTIREFARKLETMEGITSLDDIRNQFKYRTGFDATAVELTGASLKSANFETRFQQIIQNIESLNYIILVADRMEESLIAMAVEMKWPISDVLYYSLKVRDKSHDIASNDELSKNELNLFDRLQPRDYALYTAANEALDKRIEAYGRDKFMDIAGVFKTCIAKIDDRCHAVKTNSTTLNMKTFANLPRSEQTTWTGLCSHFQRDNKDLVKLAWKYDLSPPIGDIFPPGIVSGISTICKLPRLVVSSDFFSDS